MRILAIDLGDKRTGLAIGDTESNLASPLTVLVIPRANYAQLLDAIDRAIGEQLPQALIVGLPLNMDGTTNPRTKLAEQFAAELAARTGLEVHLHDERLTSVAADQRLAATGLTRKQKMARQDAIAAAILLQSFLDTHDEQGNPVQPHPTPDSAE